jgi:hypothetical protein
MTRLGTLFPALLPALLAALPASGQTLTLTGPAAARPGQTIAVNLSLAGAAGIAAWQADFGLPAGAAMSVAAGPASVAAEKTLYCRTDASRCLAVGINTLIYSGGVVAVCQVTIPQGATPGPLPIALSGLAGATLAGDNAPLTAGAAYNLLILARTDLNGDGKTDILDLQIMIQEILSGPSGPVANDQNGDGVANVRDAQIVARAAITP